jgi:hypothetical protein
MRTLTVLVAMLVSMNIASDAIAQRQAPPTAQPDSPRQREPTAAPVPDKMVEGQIGRVDPSRTEITLTDGTRLVTPAGAELRPGALTEGMTVVASYREENGEKVLTGLAVKDKAPSNKPR